MIVKLKNMPSLSLKGGGYLVACGAILLTTLPAFAAEETEARFLGLDGEQYVSIAITIFLLFVVFKVKVQKMISAALDKRIAETVAQLNDAKQLRADAESLLSQYQAKQKAAEAEATAIMAHAQTEADALMTAAKVKAGDLVERRRKMAEDRIAAAERAAIDDVKAAAANASIAAAHGILKSSLDAPVKDRLVDAAIGELDRKLH